MANQLDLEEQEQLDQLKHFWNQYGNAITWLLIAVLGSVAAWNGYQYWQRNQAAQAAALYDEIERVVRSGDLEKSERAFSEMKDRFASTVYTQHAGLLLAKAAWEAGKVDVSRSTLTWLAEKSADKGLASIAKLRLSSILIETKALDEALKVLDSGITDEFLALVADRRGDIYVLQDKKQEAKAQYLKAYKAFDERTEYRRLVEVKLGALGVTVEAGGPAAGEATAEGTK